MRILRVKSQNVMGIDLVEVLPRTGITVVGGRNGSGKCIPEGELVSLWDGTRKPIEDIRETDVLIGFNPRTWQWQPEHPEALATSGVQECCEVRMHTGFSVKCTYGHRLLAPNGWRQVDELSVGGYLAVPMRLPSCSDTALSEEEAMLLGLLLGDGCFTRGMSMTTGEPRIEAEVRRCVGVLWPDLVVRAYPRTGTKGVALNVSKGTSKGPKSNERHIKWIDQFGLSGTKARTKFVPEVVFGSGSNVIVKFLAGLYSTDGWIQEDGHCQYYSRSYKMVMSIRGLLLRIGIPSSVRTSLVVGDPFHTITIVTHEGRQKFLAMICPHLLKDLKPVNGKSRGKYSSRFALPPYVVSLLSESGCKTVRSWIRGHNRISRHRLMEAVATMTETVSDEVSKYWSEDIGWDTIDAITPIGAKQTFDLQMPSEAFVCNDFIVHNSSLLQSIAMVLGGARLIPDEPIRKGQKEARIEVDLDGDESLMIPPCMVTRTFVREENGDTTSEMEITTKDGYVAPEPQRILNRICSKLGFDPLAFVSMKPKEQAEQLLSLVGLDLTELDQKRKKAFDDRTIVTRDGKQIRAVFEAFELFPDVPEDEVPVSSLMHELEAAENVNQSIDAHGKAIEMFGHEIVIKQSLAESLAQQAEAALRAADEAHRRALELTAEREDVVKKISEMDQELANKQELQAARVKIDIAAIKARIELNDGINAKVRVNKARALAQVHLDSSRVKFKELDDLVKSLDAEKVKKIAEAPWPIPGLGYSDEGGKGHVTYNDLPLDQVSSKEQIVISLAIGAALNPTLPFMFVQHGSLLDDDGLKEIATEGAKHGCQLFVERVGKGVECNLIISDGKVESADEGMLLEAEETTTSV